MVYPKMMIIVNELLDIYSMLLLNICDMMMIKSNHGLSNASPIFRIAIIS